MVHFSVFEKNSSLQFLLYRRPRVYTVIIGIRSAFLYCVSVCSWWWGSNLCIFGNDAAVESPQAPIAHYFPEHVRVAVVLGCCAPLRDGGTAQFMTGVYERIPDVVDWQNRPMDLTHTHRNDIIYAEMNLHVFHHNLGGELLLQEETTTQQCLSC